MMLKVASVLAAFVATSALADERCATFDGDTYDGNPLATSPSIFQFSEVEAFPRSIVPCFLLQMT
jgi:hypothetical protein